MIKGMANRLRRMGRAMGNRHHKHGCCGGRHGRCMGGLDHKPLDECSENERVCIHRNPDRQTMEMGLHNGGLVIMLKNDPSDNNIVVGIGNSRFILSRRIARLIEVG